MALGAMGWASEEVVAAANYKRDKLSYMVRLGYTYLDAGCRAEARSTFQAVWESNGPGFTEFANQAREALNLMASKRQ